MKILLPLAFLLLGAVPQKSKVSGSLGSVRYTLGNDSLSYQSPNSELLALSPGAVEFLAPLNSFDELDRLARLSHLATNLCGSIDYFPLGYTLANTITHSPPYISPEYYFPALIPILNAADLTRIDRTLSSLTSLPSRFHRHPTGQNAGAKVKEIWTAELKAENTGTWSLNETIHTSTPQKSVVATLAGDSGTTVILGAHLDSINAVDGINGVAPGADDDGSGIAILTEILRIIEANNLRFHHSIELHAYAAEEIGLVGSRELASQYRKDQKKVAGMLQFDMAFYSEAVDSGLLYFLENYTSLDLTRNSIRLTKRYIGDVYRRGFLPGGSASDHKAWFEQGYPTLFPFENPEAYNPYIHSSQDTKDHFDDGVRMRRMVQLGLLFLSYQAGLKSLAPATPAEAERVASTVVAKDLFLNVQGSGGQYTFEASVTPQVVYLEYCRIDSARDFRCQGTRQRLEEGSTVSGRKIFTGETAFAKGETYRVEAFDEADVLMARRHITFE